MDAGGVCVSYNSISVSQQELEALEREEVMTGVAERLQISARDLSAGTHLAVAIQSLEARPDETMPAGSPVSLLAHVEAVRTDGTVERLSAHVPVSVSSAPPPAEISPWQVLLENVYVLELGVAGGAVTFTGFGLFADLRVIRWYRQRKEESRWKT